MRAAILAGATLFLAFAGDPPPAHAAPMEPQGQTMIAQAGRPPTSAGGGSSGPLREARTAYVSFDNTPFPYRGIVPKDNKPFLDAAAGPRRGHSSPRGGVYWEDQTYSDRRVLIYVPAGFDPRLPAVMVVFFHGNNATLSRDVVERQQLTRQFAESGLNAVLVAPQFAYNAQDSSSGHFWEPGHLNRFLKEAAPRAAEVYGLPAARGNFERMPVLLLAYSGGYQAAAYAATIGGAGPRLRGVILLDAIYAEEDKFADWIAGRPKNAFFFSAFTDSSRPNNALLQKLLTQRRVAFRTNSPAGFAQGAVTFLDAGDNLSHDDFLTRGWVNDPVKWVLSQIPGFPRPAIR